MVLIFYVHLIIKKNKRMYTYKEIVDFAQGFQPDKSNNEEEKTLKEIMKQLCFSWQECGCKSIIFSLYSKLVNWIKTHDKLSRYQMVSGVLLWTKDGKCVSATNITDELAEQIIAEGLDPKGYIKEILPASDNKEEKPVDAESINDLEQKVEEVKAKKSGKRTIKSKSK